MYILKEKLFYFGVSFVMQKKSPYKLKFSEKIEQLKQSGLIDHWIETEQDKMAKITNIGKLINELNLTSHTVCFQGTSANFSRLTLWNMQVRFCNRIMELLFSLRLQAPFLLLILGQVTAPIIVIIEILFKRLKS